MKYTDILKEDPGESDDFELISNWIVRKYISKISLDFQLNHSNLAAKLTQNLSSNA